VQSCRQDGQGLCVDRIGLRALEERFGKIVGLGRIDDRDADTGVDQGGGEAHPVRTSGFHDDQNGLRVRLKGGEPLLELGETARAGFGRS
jgi:hypothetical protein